MRLILPCVSPSPSEAFVHFRAEPAADILRFDDALERGSKVRA
jgi:hypothetical protein